MPVKKTFTNFQNKILKLKNLIDTFDAYEAQIKYKVQLKTLPGM